MYDFGKNPWLFRDLHSWCGWSGQLLSVRVSHQPWFRSYCDLSGPRHRQALRASEKICNSRSCGLRPAVLYRSRHSKGIWRDGLFLRCQDHPGPVPEHFLYVRGLRLQLEADPARRRQAVHHDRCGRLPADHPPGRAGRTGGQPHRDGPLSGSSVFLRLHVRRRGHRLRFRPHLHRLGCP